MSEVTLDTVMQALTSLAATVEDLSKRQREMQVQIGGLTEGQASLAERQASLAEGQSSLAEGQASLAGGLARLAEGQIKLRTELMARLDRLQDAQQQMRDETVVTLAVGERFERKFDANAEDARLTREQINVMQRMIRRIDDRLRAIEDREPGQGPRPELGP